MFSKVIRLIFEIVLLLWYFLDFYCSDHIWNPGVWRPECRPLAHSGTRDIILVSRPLCLSGLYIVFYLSIHSYTNGLPGGTKGARPPGHYSSSSSNIISSSMRRSSPSRTPCPRGSYPPIRFSSWARSPPCSSPLSRCPRPRLYSSAG
jgi:hypothetical protein